MQNGAADRTRTYDPIITNDVLYQLSYSGLPMRVLAPGVHAEKGYLSGTVSSTSASITTSVVGSVSVAV